MNRTEDETIAVAAAALPLASGPSEVRVAPFVIARVAGLPVAVLNALPGSGVSALAGQRRQAGTDLDAIALLLIDQLHQAISLPIDDALRGQLLACKRDVHNRRAPRAAAAFHACDSRVPESIDGLLESYRAKYAQRREIEQRIAACVEDDLHETRQVLARASLSPAFRQALGLASPALVPLLDKPWSDWPHKKRKHVERTLLGYVLRAAAKISPFSTFTASGLVEIDSQHGEAAVPQTCSWTVRTESQLNRGVATALRNALYAPQTMRERGLPLCVNPTLAFVEDSSGWRACGHFRLYEERRGGLWSEEQQFDLPVSAALREVLDGLPPRFSWAELVARLQPAEPDALAAERLAKKLLRKDVLRPTLQWGAHCQRPAQALASETAAGRPELASRLALLDEAASALATTPAEERGRAVSAIADEFSSLHASLSSQVCPGVRTPVLEDAWGEGLSLGLGPDFVERTLKRMANVVARRASLSIEYLWLRRHFLQRFGNGAVCTDLHGFLSAAWRPFMAFSQALATIPETALPAAAREGIDPSALRLPMCLYFQAAGSLDELAHGRPRIVLNGAYNRIGWQLSRATSLDVADGAGRSQRVAAWLGTAAAPHRLVSFSVSAESSNLQAQRRLAPQHLCFDEQPGTADDLLLSDLRLQHDTDSGLLRLLGPDGQPIQLQYLGAASTLPAWGLKYLLILLAEPVQIGRPAFDRILAGPNDPDVRHQPRLEEDDCVLIRETWWVRSRRVLACVEGLSPAQQVVALLDLAQSIGIPETVFVNGQFTDVFSWQSFAADKVRKPVWCHLGNRLCAEMLIGLAREADWLVFKEVFPAPADSWLQIDGHQHVAELHAEMVLVGGEVAQRWTEE